MLKTRTQGVKERVASFSRGLYKKIHRSKKLSC